MQILSIQSRDYGTDSEWHYPKVELGKINLIVGDSGTGKTRFLNTIFNMGSSAVAREFTHVGYWDTTFKQSNVTYRWIVEAKKDEKKQEIVVTSEKLMRLSDVGAEENIVERSADYFRFQGKELPKLSENVSSISLLKHEAIIEPIYKGFSNIVRRRFFDDALRQASEYQVLPIDFVNRVGRERDLDKIFHSNSGLNVRLYILSEFFQDLFARMCNYYKAVFPFITDIRILDFNSLHKDAQLPGRTPVFCIREKSVGKWIELQSLSSGMQKVLLILTDSFLLPEGGIYLIDEYENSLGISAIDFFPNFLLTFEKDAQFMITSHHPYIVNNIPVSNWLIFHRKGSEVSVKYGESLKERFGKSKQQAFIQLINDPFYTEGIE